MAVFEGIDIISGLQSPVVVDTIRRNIIDRLLYFLSYYDDNNNGISGVYTDTNDNGYLTTIMLVTATDRRYTRPMDWRMTHRLEVFNYITLYFGDPLFPHSSELIDNAMVLLETLFKVDEHRFDVGVRGMHLNQRPLTRLSMRDMVAFIRHVYDWELDQGIDSSTPMPPQPQKLEEHTEGHDAFIAKIDALLAEEDDTDLPPENQLPKAMPTG